MGACGSSRRRPPRDCGKRRARRSRGSGRPFRMGAFGLLVVGDDRAGATKPDHVLHGPRDREPT
jgi:hypothetical protein